MKKRLPALLTAERSIFSLVTSVSLLLTGGHSTSIDEETYLAGLRSFLHGRAAIDMASVTAQSVIVVPGRGGALTSFYGFGTTLFNLPMYAIGKLLSSLVGEGSREQVLRMFLYSTNSIALGVTALYIFKICRSLNVAPSLAAWASLTFAFCTYALPMAGGGFSEPLTAMFLTAAIYLLVCKDPTTTQLTMSGGLLGCAVLMRSSSLLFVPIIGLFLLLSSPRSSRLARLLAGAAGGVLPIAVFLFVNYWRFGNFLKTGYPALTYDTPVYEGLFGLFLSSGKGLVWFAPITVVAILTIRSSLRTHRYSVLLLWACVLTNALFFGRFEIWSGDDAFGPRYMLIVLPLIAVLAAVGASALPRWSLIGTSGFGLIASLGGTLVYFNAANQARLENLIQVIGPSSRNLDGSLNSQSIRQALWFRPRLSQLVYQFSQIDDAVAGTWRFARAANSPSIFVNGNGPAISWYSRAIRLDLWWTYLLETSAPRVMLLGVPMFLAVALLSTALLWRHLGTRHQVLVDPVA